MTWICVRCTARLPRTTSRLGYISPGAKLVKSNPSSNAGPELGAQGRAGKRPPRALPHIREMYNMRNAGRRSFVRGHDGHRKSKQALVFASIGFISALASGGALAATTVQAESM